MQNRHQIAIILVIVGILATAGTGLAQNVKARMKARLPLIIGLKDRGVVGENNKGFLEFLNQKKEKPNVVEAENKDRLSVYKAIARQLETTPELVGRQRAAKIAEKSKPGEWIQNAKGEWYQKR